MDVLPQDYPNFESYSEARHLWALPAYRAACRAQARADKALERARKASECSAMLIDHAKLAADQVKLAIKRLERVKEHERWASNPTINHLSEKPATMTLYDLLKGLGPIGEEH